MDGSVDFFREWTAYRSGFGSLDGEFYAGSSVFKTMVLYLMPVLPILISNWMLMLLLPVL